MDGLRDGSAVLRRPTVDYVLSSVLAGWWTHPSLEIRMPLARGRSGGNGASPRFARPSRSRGYGQVTALLVGGPTPRTTVFAHEPCRFGPIPVAREYYKSSDLTLGAWQAGQRQALMILLYSHVAKLNLSSSSNSVV